MAKSTVKPTLPSPLLLPQARYPLPLRCQCGALLMKLTGPARLEVKCRRCARLLTIEAT